MTGFPNRGSGTNPLPEWYWWFTNLSADELRGLSSRELRRAALEQGGIQFQPRTVDQAQELTAHPPEPADRGPFGLRLRLWWMRLWLPSERTYRRRNASLLISAGCYMMSGGAVAMVIDSPPWATLSAILFSTLISMTVTRSWRADQEWDR